MSDKSDMLKQLSRVAQADKARYARQKACEDELARVRAENEKLNEQISGHDDALLDMEAKVEKMYRVAEDAIAALSDWIYAKHSIDHKNCMTCKLVKKLKKRLK